MGHGDVVFDQEHDRLHSFFIQSQTAASFFGKFGPAADMAAPLTFADVVQEQGQIKQRRIVYLLKDSVEMRATFVFADVQFVNRFDGSQRVLVNRKMVVVIMLNQETDTADFRDQTREQSDVVHRAKDIAGSAAPAQQR
jgi:hypothetical protein